MKTSSSKQNYLEYIPAKNQVITWDMDTTDTATLFIENTGFFNRTAQKIFHRPRFTQVHLAKLGSFVWNNINGEKNIIQLGQEVDDFFGTEAEPLYERLAEYLQTLENCRLINLKT